MIKNSLYLESLTLDLYIQLLIEQPLFLLYQFACIFIHPKFYFDFLQIVVQHIQNIRQQALSGFLNLQYQEVSQQAVKLICTLSQHIDTFWLDSTPLSSLKMTHFTNTKWGLTSLVIKDQSIGDKGWKYLTRASMKHLSTLKLYRNNIGNEGSLHLSKGQWRYLDKFCLTCQKLRQTGVYWLTKGNWIDIREMEIGYLAGMRMSNLLLSEFNEIRLIYLNANQNEKKIYEDKFGDFNVREL